MKKYIYSIILVTLCIVILYKNYDPYKNRPFEIKEMKFLNQYYFFSKDNKTYSRNFLVSGYKYNDNLQDSLIDVYVCNIMDSLGYENCGMAFYKESKYTNIEYLLDYPKGIVRESSNDLVIKYIFKKDTFNHKTVLFLNKDKSINSRIDDKLRCPK